MKKVLALLLAMTLVIGCGAAFADAEPTEIEFWTFQDLHIAFYEAMAEEWNAQNPDRQIKLKSTPFPF